MANSTSGPGPPPGASWSASTTAHASDRPSNVAVPRPTSSRMTSELRGGVAQDVRHLGHLDHERRLAAGDVVGGADAGEDAVDLADLGLLGGDERAGPRHDHRERDLAQVGRLAAHVRAGEDHDLARVAVELDVVGDERRARELLDHRVARADEPEPRRPRPGAAARSRAAAPGRRRSASTSTAASGAGGGGQARGARGAALEQRGEQLPLALLGARLGGRRSAAPAPRSSGVTKRSAPASVCRRTQSAGTRSRLRRATPRTRSRRPGCSGSCRLAMPVRHAPAPRARRAPPWRRGRGCRASSSSASTPARIIPGPSSAGGSSASVAARSARRSSRASTSPPSAASSWLGDAASSTRSSGRTRERRPQRRQLARVGPGDSPSRAAARSRSPSRRSSSRSVAEPRRLVDERRHRLVAGRRPRPGRRAAAPASRAAAARPSP